MTPAIVLVDAGAGDLGADAAPKDGWDARRTYDYDVAQNAKRVVTAIAYRKGMTWTAIAVDVDQAVAEKRGSQFGKLTQRFQPAGYVRENFAGRSARRLDDARLQQVAAFVERMRKEFDVPGVAIGIVQDGKVVMSRGFDAARDAQISADRATRSGCEGVSVSSAEPTSPTQGLSAHTINQLGSMWS